MRWVTAKELEDWARTVSSELDLPAVISDLIRATAPDIASMRFPNGDKGRVRGFDGYLDAGVAGFNVPAGLSFWEFGTNEDYKGKANRDFGKRTKETPKETQAQTTYVFVSPWTWDSSDPANKREEWIKAAKATVGVAWRDILYIDGAMLETWLDECPAVAAWHARETFKVWPREGVRSCEEFWLDFAGQFGPPLTEEVLLCGREEVANQLLTSLMSASDTSLILADAEDEAVAFAIAAIRKAEASVRLFLEARTLVVDTLAAGRQLVTRQPLTLLLRNDATKSPGQLASKGPLLVPVGRRQGSAAKFVLERPGGQAMGMAMETMGLDPNRALTLARGSGRSLRALARLIPGGNSDEPAWVKADGLELLPGILAGSWDATNENDRQIVERVAGQISYGVLEGRIRRHLTALDPPFDLEGAVWKVRAPMDAFILVGPLLDRALADRLRGAMLDVFGALESEPDPDAVVGFARVDPTGYSRWVRDGLATTFLLIAVWGETAGVNLGGQSGQEWANQVLADVPGLGADHRVLASLRAELPLLAEGAPDPLLSALEQMLEGNGDAIRPIFEAKAGIFHEDYTHTGLLWALETIAWDPAKFRRAVMVLAALAAIAPEMKLVNTPAHSLTEIFVLWNPNTNAPWPARLSALQEICRRFPEVGWPLVEALLPTLHGSSSPTARPKLREGGAAGRPQITYQTLWEHQAEITILAMDLAGMIEARWIALIPKLGEFTPELREVAFAKLDELLETSPPEKLKRVWTRLRDEARRHERFPSAGWALKGPELAPLSALVSKYAPTDPVSTLVTLFDTYAFDAMGDIQSASEQRLGALTELLRDHGPPAVVRLAQEARGPYLVVETIGRSDLSVAAVEALLTASYQERPQSALTIGLSGVYRQKAGEAAAQTWIVARRAEQPAEVVADLIDPWPDELPTWTFVRRQGPEIASAYWSRRTPRYLKGSRRSLLRATLMSLRYGRAVEALQAALDRLDEIPTKLMFRLLDGVVPELNARPVAADTMTTFYIQKALEALDARDAPIEQLARFEFAVFPLLEYDGARQLAIYKLLSKSPQLFMQLMVNVFRGDNEEDVAEPTQQARETARRSYSLLTKFTLVPGADGAEIDADVLRLWVQEAVDLGRAARRLGVTESFIGRLFAHAPQDPVDGAWPHRAIRAEIERLQSTELERGVQLERFNMRGVHRRQLYEGGAQERTLAQRYDGWANTVIPWPRTAAVLHAIATMWAEDAQREDVEAAQRMLRS